MPESIDVFIEKAIAALAGAESELAAGRYENVANRCYYACFQVAIAALEAAGVRPVGGADARWSHQAVQAQFDGVLIARRKRYPSRPRDVLYRVSLTRQKSRLHARPGDRRTSQTSVAPESRIYRDDSR